MSNLLYFMCWTLIVNHLSELTNDLKVESKHLFCISQSFVIWHTPDKISHEYIDLEIT